MIGFEDPKPGEGSIVHEEFAGKKLKDVIDIICDGGTEERLVYLVKPGLADNLFCLDEVAVALVVEIERVVLGGKRKGERQKKSSQQILTGFHNLKYNDFFITNKEATPIGMASLFLGTGILVTVLGRNGEFLAAVTTAGCKHPATIGRGHTLTESVLVDALAA